MRLATPGILVLMLAAACGGSAKPVAGGGGGGGSAAVLGDPMSETVGGIKLGDSAELVVKTFGEPDAKGPEEEMGATGEFVSDWTWAKHGLTLSMGATSAGGPVSVGSITIAPPSTLTTSRGVGIGTARADVDRIYHDFLGKGRQDEEPDTTSPEQLIVGSIYGGTMFSFVDGKVSGIFVGAGAE